MCPSSVMSKEIEKMKTMILNDMDAGDFIRW